jgi:hypothetical protein
MIQKELTEYQSDGHRCPKCGSVHKTYRGVKVHYGRAHDGSIAGEPVECSVCGKTVRKPRSHIEGVENPVCSQACNSELTAQREPWNKQERETTVCDWCGNEFCHPPFADRRFCSRDCYDEHQSENGHFNGETNPHYDGGKSTYTCENCNEKYESYPSIAGKYCSTECQYEAMTEWTGQDHPQWEGGARWYRSIRSSLGPTGWRTQRKENLADECALCGTGDETLALHHIVPVLAGGTNGEYNYMTLCRSCHNIVEAYTKGLTGVDSILTDA